MADWTIEQYFPVADMLAKTFGDSCEVVIHDLSTPQNSVVYAVNGHVTGRKVGQSFDHLIRQVLLNQSFSNDYTANYYFHTEDGRLIKSSTVLLRNAEKKVAGAMCINMDTTVLRAAAAMISGLLPGIAENTGMADESREKTAEFSGGQAPDTVGLQLAEVSASRSSETPEAPKREDGEETAESLAEGPQNIMEIAEDLIEKIIGESEPANMKRDEKIALIRFMDQKGLFLIKGTIDKVAKRLGISKVTVYSYLDEIKENP